MYYYTVFESTPGSNNLAHHPHPSARYSYSTNYVFLSEDVDDQLTFDDLDVVAHLEADRDAGVDVEVDDVLLGGRLWLEAGAEVEGGGGGVRTGRRRVGVVVVEVRGRHVAGTGRRYLGGTVAVA